MGTRGPVPKPEGQRRRRNATAAAPTKAETATTSTMPPPDDDWHPAARDWYKALATSSQARYYEPSDWATAWVVAESLSRDLKPKFVGFGEDGPIYAPMPLAGASLTSYLRAATLLLVTEADRRRMALDLKRAEVAPAAEEAVAILDDYRHRRGGAG
jgi:hypothetical protein